ncbi:MAG: sigma-70 family RNA polymerase sigma factor [Minicystis sp.]
MRAEVELVREGYPVVEKVAKRMAQRLGRFAELDELRSIGRFALVEVARSYDPSKSAFATYAAFKLKWAMFDEVRRATHGRSAAAKLNAVLAAERLLDDLDTDPPDTGEMPSAEDWEARFGEMLDDQAAALASGLASPGLLDLRDEATSPEEQTSRAEQAALLRGALATLEEPARQLIERHYYGGEQFDAIAEELGISKSWASRIHKKAIGELGKALQGAA